MLSLGIIHILYCSILYPPFIKEDIVSYRILYPPLLSKLSNFMELSSKNFRSKLHATINNAIFIFVSMSRDLYIQITMLQV